MLGGISTEYTSHSFPRILSPMVAQVLYLTRQLRDYAQADANRQSALQAMNLGRLLRWAHTHSSYWQALLTRCDAPDFADPWQTLSQLPILRRIDLQDSMDQLSCVAALPPDSCVMAHSTGSTGQPIRTWKERQPYQLRYLAFTGLTAQWHRLDRSKDMLRISARVQDGEQPSWGPPDNWYEPTGKLVLARSLGRDLQEIYQLLQGHRPGYLVGTSSIAHALALHAKHHDPDRPRIDAILATGETVTDTMRRDCLEVFGAKVINRYTCEEAGWLALQCPKHDHLHVFTANVILEIVDAQGQPCPVGIPGRVLVTALHSQAMPLIRYEIGDVAEWGTPCDCGINLPVIKRIWGRDKQWIEAPDGRVRYIVLVAEDFLAIAPLRDMRLRYYQNPLARLEVACDEALTSEQGDRLVAKVRDLLGFDCPVDLIAGATIDWGATDKRLGFAVIDSLAPALPSP